MHHDNHQAWMEVQTEINNCLRQMVKAHDQRKPAGEILARLRHLRAERQRLEAIR